MGAVTGHFRWAAVAGFGTGLRLQVGGIAGMWCIMHATRHAPGNMDPWTVMLQPTLPCSTLCTQQACRVGPSSKHGKKSTPTFVDQKP